MAINLVRGRFCRVVLVVETGLFVRFRSIDAIEIQPPRPEVKKSIRIVLSHEGGYWVESGVMIDENADANPDRSFVRTLRRKFGNSAAHPAWDFNKRGVGCRMPRPGEG